jgi:hypothetical protein
MVKRLRFLLCAMVYVALVLGAGAAPKAYATSSYCVPPGGWDDLLYKTDCCSGQAVPGGDVNCYPPFNDDLSTCYHQCL